MVKAERKEGETVEALMRRFKKQLLQSGVIPEARERLFYGRKISRNQRRKEAQARENIRKEREHQRKIGKLKPNKKRGYRR